MRGRRDLVLSRLLLKSLTTLTPSPTLAPSFKSRGAHTEAKWTGMKPIHFLLCAVDGTWTRNLSRARSHYFHNGVDYIFTIAFALGTPVSSLYGALSQMKGSLGIRIFIKR